MKFLHLGDLHIGKRLNNISLLEDQRYILGQILDIAREERPDAVLIAGDVYDRTLPPAEAVTLLDDFLTALAGEKDPRSFSSAATTIPPSVWPSADGCSPREGCIFRRCMTVS